MISKDEVEKLYRRCVRIYEKGGSEGVWQYLEKKSFPHKGMCLKCEGIRHVDPYDHSCMACGQLAPENFIAELSQKERRAVEFALNHLLISLDEANKGILDDPFFGMGREEFEVLRAKFSNQ
jgi:hypothetical protein